MGSFGEARAFFWKLIWVSASGLGLTGFGVRHFWGGGGGGGAGGGGGLADFGV